MNTEVGGTMPEEDCEEGRQADKESKGNSEPIHHSPILVHPHSQAFSKVTYETYS